MLKTFAFVLLVFSQTILANDLYRCGNTYQDTPCKSTASSKPVSKSVVKNSAKQTDNTSVMNKKQTPIAMNDDCKQRGESAKKIIRMREAGKTVDDQLKAERDSDSQALIKDVYSRSGSSFQVQKAIERECTQQKQKTRLTSKWMTEAKQLLGIGTAPAKSSANSEMKPPPAPAVQAATGLQPAPPSMQPMPVQSAPANPPTSTVQKEEPGDEQGVCSSLKAGLENIAKQKRKGGNAAHMKDLKQQQYQLESAMKSVGC